MRALERKLLRDLVRMAPQLAAIALVVASGVALFIATMTTYRSLRLSETKYYEQQRFGAVWSSLARAPLSVARDVRSLPGVEAVDARIVTRAILDVPGLVEPASALLISMPETPEHSLNALYIRFGRRLEANRSGEVLVSEAFAEKNHLRPGDRVSVVIGGRRVALKIAGVALSPEYVMQVPAGALSPDDRRFAVLWLSRSDLEQLADLRGAFNDLSVKLAPRASEAAVVRELDRLLEPYGGRGAFGRASQASHVMLEEHINQLKALAVLVPGIFLAVGAFLVNVVLARIVATEREQIGMLKACGYSHRRVAAHYLEFAMSVVASGLGLGVPIGVWLGRLMAMFYASFFRFPVLVFRLEPWVAAAAGLVAVGAAVAGAFGAVRRVVTLPPIVAMSPEVPAFSRSAVDAFGLSRWLPPALRMILRNVVRRPLRAVLTSAGMALAVAVVVLGSSSTDAIHRSEDVEFQAAERQDVSVKTAGLRSLAAVRGFTELPGVRRAEPYRAVAARVGRSAATQDVTLLGLPAGGTLRRPIGGHYELASVAGDAAVLTSWLGQKLGLRRGDRLAIDVREGRPRTVVTRVAGFVDEPLGETIYMELGALDRLLGEPETYSGVNLLLDRNHERESYGALKRSPRAAAVSLRRGTLESFRGMSERAVTFVRQIEVIFAVIIAFGVVYNGAWIALAERSRELGTLRVLGFTRAEISSILLGEIAVLAVPAIPLGLVSGYFLTSGVLTAMRSARMHMPLLVEASTYTFAIAVFMLAALASALVVRRRLDTLDLVAVLKAKE